MQKKNEHKMKSATKEKCHFTEVEVEADDDEEKKN